MASKGLNTQPSRSPLQYQGSARTMLIAKGVVVLFVLTIAGPYFPGGGQTGLAEAKPWWEWRSLPVSNTDIQNENHNTNTNINVNGRPVQDLPTIGGSYPFNPNNRGSYPLPPIGGEPYPFSPINGGLNPYPPTTRGIECPNGPTGQCYIPVMYPNPSPRQSPKGNCPK